MDAERALVTKIAHTGKGAIDLLADGLAREHFVHDDCWEVYDFIVRHAEKYRKQPTVNTILDNFKFNFEMSDEPLSFIKDQFVKNIERREVEKFVTDVLGPATHVHEEQGRLGEILLEEGRRIMNLLPSGEVERLSNVESHIRQYEEMAAMGDPYMGRLRLGIPQIDEATMGIQQHELVSVVGWQGTGKSTLAQWILWNFAMQQKKCLFISLEMTAETLFRKWHQMIQQFTSYKHFKQGNLTDDEVKRWKKWASEQDFTKMDIIVNSQGGDWTPDRVHGEIVRHRPDIVAVDYITLMDISSKTNSQRWEKITQISQSLKNIAQSERVPIFSVAQTNRESSKSGAQLDNIAGSFSLGAASDIVIGLHQDDEMRTNKLMKIDLIKNRDGDQTTLEVYWDMERMRFADDYLTEQQKKIREASKLEAVPEPEENRKKQFRLGNAQAMEPEAGASLADMEARAAEASE